MKRTVLILLSSLFLLMIFSCATKPNPIEVKTEEKKVEKVSDDPRIPCILEMGFSDRMGESSRSMEKAKSGKSAVLYMKLRDREWDLAGVSITAENGSKKDYVSFDFDYQYSEEFVYASSIVMPDEKGKWTFTAVAFDHQGNRSSPMKASIIVE
ncbi:MAG: hypothetical protein II716_08670 [Treponema sp.]|nr:hypothetical protein [Treponema sp.]